MSNTEALHIWLAFLPAFVTALAGFLVSLSTLLRVLKAFKLAKETHSLVNGDFKKQTAELIALKEEVAALRAARENELNRTRPSV